MTWTVLVSILLVEIAAISVMMWINDVRYLRQSVVVNLFMVMCFGSLLADFGGYVSNYGNAWYSGAIAAQMLVLDRFGPKEARFTMAITYLMITLLLAASWPLSYAPVLPANETLPTRYNPTKTHVLVA